jgi:hypothetical protein
MTYETETGFGSGLRAELARKQGGVQLEAPPEPAAATEPTVVDLFAPAAEELDGDPQALRAELEAAIGREQQLRDALRHQVEAYERELASGRELALREAEAEQLAARLESARSELEERDLILRIQREQVDEERATAAAQRAELVAEEARLAELGTHIDARAQELQSVDQERAQAAAHLAQQLAGLAERERELKRERVALDARRQQAETAVAARERSVRELNATAARREQAVSQRELSLQSIDSEVSRERARLQERSDALAAREATFERRNEARGRMLANSESALGAREKRLREQAERLERERAGHGNVSQEAFALLDELEQREQRIGERESKLLEAEAAFEERRGEVERAGEALRAHEARSKVDHEMWADQLDARERTLEHREQLIGDRDRDLAAYVGELQGRFGDRSVA